MRRFNHLVIHMDGQDRQDRKNKMKTTAEKYVVSVDTMSGEYVARLTDENGKPSVHGTTKRAEAIKYTRAEADRIAAWIGYCTIVLGDYSEYTTTVDTDPSNYGDCSADEAAVIVDKLQAMIEAEFPGIQVRREKTLGVGKHPVNGPDGNVCAEIHEWINDKWITATEI